ncbi:hypothetical protein BP5796_05713 [Coleophoma crateriformis]|uniref:Amidase domain-containing protein n=1 Tax=Coleophoma crateriformis TaxID=565419 RepID=A0A3D8RVM8_9HELO|nr:hypothetical protein BP5796_05713 [Coleophoma crateriformis]
MPSIDLEELTVDGVHQSYMQGRYNAEALVAAYQQRIQRLEHRDDGPCLNSILSLNPEALADAKKLDDGFKTDGKFVGPLHGIPIMVKDDVLTKGLHTTFGSMVAKSFVAKEDATVIRRLRDAGAIILAKTSMPDFGSDYFSTSSMNGHVRNPYDLDRDTGGSSSGTGAAVAANLTVIGLGGDTGGSIRIPAALCNLVGVKPTVGLISAAGCLTLVAGQSTLGPICRSVKDAAIVMDALVGFDEADIRTGINQQAGAPVGGSYTAQLGVQDISTMRLGVVRSLFGDDRVKEQEAVNGVTNAALAELRAAGCKLVDVEIPSLENYLQSTSLFLSRAKADLNAFITPTLGTNLNEIVEKGNYPKGNVMMPHVAANGAASPYEWPSYAEQVDQRENFQLGVMSAMSTANVSALIFPTTKVPAPRYADIDMKMRANFPANTGFASSLRFPAITVPIGFTVTPTMPVGLEIVGVPLSDQLLLNISYAIENLVKGRRAPKL